MLALTIRGRGTDEESHGLGWCRACLGFSIINEYITEQTERPDTWRRRIGQKYNDEVEDRSAPVFARLRVCLLGCL